MTAAAGVFPIATSAFRAPTRYSDSCGLHGLHVTTVNMPPASKSGRRTSKSATSREKVRAHRKRLRAQGLRPIQIWVPDVRSPKFAAQASRQSRLVAASAHAVADQAFIDALSTGYVE